MHSRTSQALKRALVVSLVLAVGFTIWQSWTAAAPGVSGVVQTKFGPLTPADRDLLAKVRLAGLWEMPTGQQMQQQASSPAVKEVGRKIAVEHMVLDQSVRTAAGAVDVPLPSSPAAQHVTWMKDISSRTGADYDRTAVKWLRTAHGIVLPVVAQVRVGTRNSVVRALAAEAQAYVTRHIGYLESTGLVDYASLPRTTSTGVLTGARGWDLVLPGLGVMAVVAGVAIGAGRWRRRQSVAGAPPLDERVASVLQPYGTGTVLTRYGPDGPGDDDAVPRPRGPRHGARS